eukprot:15841-Pelagococcus_subviridis.AAC.1
MQQNPADESVRVLNRPVLHVRGLPGVLLRHAFAQDLVSVPVADVPVRVARLKQTPSRRGRRRGRRLGAFERFVVVVAAAAAAAAEAKQTTDERHEPLVVFVLVV